MIQYLSDLCNASRDRGIVSYEDHYRVIARKARQTFHSGSSGKSDHPILNIMKKPKITELKPDLFTLVRETVKASILGGYYKFYKYRNDMPNLTDQEENDLAESITQYIMLEFDERFIWDQDIKE